MDTDRVPYLSHMSLKIGIIVASMNIPFILSPISGPLLFAVMLCASWLLWASVWRLGLGLADDKTAKLKDRLFHKPYAAFGVHVFATALPSFAINHIPGFIR